MATGSVSIWEMCAPYIDRLGSTGQVLPRSGGEKLTPKAGQTGRQVGLLLHCLAPWRAGGGETGG